jgi:hypothetical protein
MVRMPHKINHGYCGLFHRASTSVPSSLNETARTIAATVATEDPCLVWDNNRYEPIMEVLLMSGAVLPENRQVPLLDNHDRSQTASVRGSARNLTINQNRLDSDVHFSTIAEDAWTLAREGDLKDLSAGYQTYASSSTVIPAGESAVVNGRDFQNSFDLPLVIRGKWKLKEVSLTPIGADETTKFRHDQENKPEKNDRNDIADQTNLTRETVSTVENKTFNTTLTKENQMPENTQERKEVVQPVAPAPVAPAVVDTNAIADAARRETEEAVTATLTARTTEILDTCRSLSLSDEYARELIGNKKPIAEVRKMIIDKATENMKPVTVSVSVDEVDKTRGAMVDGLSYRAGYTFTTEKKNEIETKNPFRGVGIHALARHCQEKSGERGVSMKDSVRLIDDQITLSTRTLAQGNDDFSYVLGAVANKFLLKGWQETEVTYPQWTGTGVLNNFNTANLVKLSLFPDMKEIGENESPEITALSDAYETGTLKTYGGAWGLTRKAMINDDKNAFSRVPASLSGSARRTLDRLVYSTLIGDTTTRTGPTMKEGSAVMFSTTRGNLASAGGAPTVTTVATARAALRKIKTLVPKPGADTIYTQGTLKYILAGEEQWGILSQITGSIVDPTATYGQALNPIQKLGLQVITTPYLNTKEWYGACNANDVQHIAVYTLAGYDAPTMTSSPSQIGQPLGFVYQIIYDAAVVAEDWRGIYRNAGQ